MADIFLRLEFASDMDWATEFVGVRRLWIGAGLCERGVDDPASERAFSTTVLAVRRCPAQEIYQWVYRYEWSHSCEVDLSAPTGRLLLPLRREQRDGMVWYALLAKEYLRLLGEKANSARWHEGFPNQRGPWMNTNESGTPRQVRIPSQSWGDNSSVGNEPELLSYIDRHPFVSLSDDYDLALIVKVGRQPYRFTHNIVNGLPLSGESEVSETIDLDSPILDVWKATWPMSGNLESAIASRFGVPAVALGPVEAPEAADSPGEEVNVMSQLVYTNIIDNSAVLFRIFSNGMIQVDLGERV